jgi:hypothetical protein
MRNVSVRNALGLLASLAIVGAPLSLPSQNQRDICVEILQPVTSEKASSVEVSIRDCLLNPPPPTQDPSPPNLPNLPPVLPSLSFDAALEVSSEGKRICGTTTRVNVFGPPLPPLLSRVFRFQVIYTLDQGPSQLPSQLTRAVPYTIKASAQVDDGTPVNNQSTKTVRFPPGGKAGCAVVPKPPTRKTFGP